MGTDQEPSFYLCCHNTSYLEPFFNCLFGSTFTIIWATIIKGKLSPVFGLSSQVFKLQSQDRTASIIYSFWKARLSLHFSAILNIFRVVLTISNGINYKEKEKFRAGPKPRNQSTKIIVAGSSFLQSLGAFLKASFWGFFRTQLLRYFF